MDDITRYLNFVKKYNEKLKEKDTDWLNSKDMSRVLLDTAIENKLKSKSELKEGENSDDS